MASSALSQMTRAPASNAHNVMFSCVLPGRNCLRDFHVYNLVVWRMQVLCAGAKDAALKHTLNAPNVMFFCVLPP